MCLSATIVVMNSVHVLYIIYAFVLGTALGSFALVLADRMHAGRDWVRSRSSCDHCGHVLNPIDLVPIISWTAQNGKCRYCKHPISFYYPLVELGLGVAFALSVVAVPYELVGLGITQLLLWLFGLVIMAALVVSDFKWFLLPSKLVYPLVAIAGVHRVIDFIRTDQAVGEALVATTAALLIGAGLFWALNTLSKGKWIGDGDYRFGVALALYVGDPFLAWIALFFASVFGLMAAAPFMLHKKPKNKMKLKIPFGPFLIAGLMASYLFGERLISWYLNTFVYF